MRLLISLSGLVCLLLGFWLSSGQAFAETIPSIATNQVQDPDGYSWYASFALNNPYSSPSIACSEACSGYATSFPTASYRCVADDGPDGTMTHCLGDLYDGRTNYPYGYLAYDVGCVSPATLQGGQCVITTYSCPASGTWTLSTDKLTCTGCPDPAAPTLTAEGACVGATDKDTGEQDCRHPPGDSSQPDPFLE